MWIPILFLFVGAFHEKRKKSSRLKILAYTCVFTHAQRTLCAVFFFSLYVVSHAGVVVVVVVVVVVLSCSRPRANDTCM